MELAKYMSLDDQVSKITNILIILDMLDSHGMRVTDEIEVLEHIQDKLFNQIEKRNRKEAKK
jgi:hypothetical protein